MLRLFPPPAFECEPQGIYDELRPLTTAAGRPSVALNIVTSVDCKAALHGGAATLGSTLDHQLMRAIRAAHDAVLLGAGTLRAEPVDPRVGARWREARVQRGQSPEPLAVLLSATGALPLERRYFTHQDLRRLVVVGSEASLARRAAIASKAEILLAPTASPEPVWVAEALFADYGVRRLLIEGGPSVNGAFLAAGLVDEVFWTLAPKLVGGGERVTMLSGPALAEPASLALVSAYLHEDEWFMRYRVVRVVLGDSALT